MRINDLRAAIKNIDSSAKTVGSKQGLQKILASLVIERSIELEREDLKEGLVLLRKDKPEYGARELYYSDIDGWHFHQSILSETKGWVILDRNILPSNIFFDDIFNFDLID